MGNKGKKKSDMKKLQKMDKYPNTGKHFDKSLLRNKSNSLLGNYR